METSTSTFRISFSVLKIPGGPHGDLRPVGLEIPSALDGVSCSQGIRYLARIGKILRDPFQAAGDPDFFRLISVGDEFPHLADGAHFVVDLVRKVPQLPISVPLAVDGYQHGDGIAEIGVDHRPHDAGGEFGALHHIQLVAQLRPEDVGILDVVLQFHVDDDHAGTARGIGLFLPHLGKLEDVLLKGLRYLFFHLLGGRSGVHRGHQPGSDGDRRIFRPLHFQEGMNADHDDHCRQYEGNGGIAKRKLYRFHTIYPLAVAVYFRTVCSVADTARPFLSFVCPARTISSLPERPLFISTFLLTAAPISTRLV